MERIFKGLNMGVMRYNHGQDMDSYPKVHLGICATLLQLRQDIHQTGLLSIQSRKRKMRELFITEFLDQDRELREVDRAFINTQP